MTERSEFVATIDLRQVETSLQRTRTETTSVVTANGQLETSLVRVEKAAARTSVGVLGLGKGLTGFKGAIGGVAGATVGLTSSLGAASGATGKLLASTGQLAGAYAAGGGLAVGLAGAAVAVNLLVEHWAKLNDEQDKALQKEFAATDKVAVLKNKLREDVRDLRIQVAEKDLPATAKAYNAVQREIQVIYDQMVELLKKGKDLSANEAEAARGMGRVIEGLREKQALSVTMAKGTPKAAATGKATAAAVPGYGEPGDIAAELKRQEDERLAIVEDGRAAAWEIRQAEVRDWIAGEEEKRAAAIVTARQAEELARQAAENARANAAALGGLTESLAAATGNLIAQGLTGQQDAFAAFLASAAEIAGGFIMLEGGKVIAAGVAQLLLTGGVSPLGWSQVVGGSALVTAGAAIKTGGPAAIGQLLGASGGGGGGGVVGGGGGETDRGAPHARSRGGGGGGGSVTIVQQWGVAGPHAEDSARAVRRSLKVADRRRFT